MARVITLNELQSEDTVSDFLKDCSEEEISLIHNLKEPLSRNELIQNMDLPSEEVCTLITILEIKGLVKEHGGKLHRDF